MSVSVEFPIPLRATQRCRHYSYNRDGFPHWHGPQCAMGCDMTEPGAITRCMPDAETICPEREEYTEAERLAWKEWLTQSMHRLSAAIAALPAPIPLNTSGELVCPNCGGRLQYIRWHRGAAIQCSTENCCGARFSIEAGADWPSPKDR